MAAPSGFSDDVQQYQLLEMTEVASDYERRLSTLTSLPCPKPSAWATSSRATRSARALCATPAAEAAHLPPISCAASCARGSFRGVGHPETTFATGTFANEADTSTLCAADTTHGDLLAWLRFVHHSRPNAGPVSTTTPPLMSGAKSPGRRHTRSYATTSTPSGTHPHTTPLSWAASHRRDHTPRATRDRSMHSGYARPVSASSRDTARPSNWPPATAQQPTTDPNKIPTPTSQQTPAQPRPTTPTARTPRTAPAATRTAANRELVQWLLPQTTGRVLTDDLLYAAELVLARPTQTIGRLEGRGSNF